MHTRQVAIPAWRWHHQQASRPLVEPLWRRVAAENIVLLSSGGSDWIGGSGKADRVEGGYRITARKVFPSGAPVGGIPMTSAICEESGEHTVGHFGAPMEADGANLLIPRKAQNGTHERIKAACIALDAGGRFGRPRDISVVSRSGWSHTKEVSGETDDHDRRYPAAARLP